MNILTKFLTKRYVAFKKNEIKPWQRKGWVIPPKENGSFVANMEMVLDVYKRPYDPKYPVICMDESPKQLIAEAKTPISPCLQGQPAKYDYEYKRCGVYNIFLYPSLLPISTKHIKQTKILR